MSPSPAAPSSASISACAMTSPSEWPASPRGWSSSTPPSTSGTPSSSACASTRSRCGASATAGGYSGAGGEPGLDPLEVVRRRHLEQPLVARDDLDPAAGRLDERGAVGALAPRGCRAQDAEATNACGVCTATSSSRAGVSTTTPSRTRLTVSATGRPGTAPSKPSASASSRRGTSSGGSSGRAASWTRTTAASVGHLREPDPHRGRAGLAAGDAGGDLRRADLLGEQDRGLLPLRGATTTIAVDPLALVEPPQRLGEERETAEARERLRAVLPEPLAPPCGDEHGPDAHVAIAASGGWRLRRRASRCRPLRRRPLRAGRAAR